MSDTFYSADRRVYRFPAVAIDTAAVFGRFTGPLGKIGRVRGMEYIITTATTVAVSLITCGNNGATLPAAMTVAIAAANLGGRMTAAQVKAAGADDVAGTNDVELTADAVVEVASDGGATAGDGDITVTVDWY